MKSIFRMLLTGALVAFLSAFSCAQNGPTQPSITVGFTQAVPTSTSGPVVANCVYLGTVSGTYAKPGTCSSGPVTSFIINSGIARGTQYFIAVTAQYTVSGKLVESGYSNEVTATSPVINPPTNGTGTGAQLDYPITNGPQPVVTADNKLADGAVGSLKVLKVK